MAPMTNMQKARAKLLLQYVFWAGIIIPTPMIEDETIPTACTDMKSVRYNPKFINSLTTEVVLFVLVHDGLHVWVPLAILQRAAVEMKWLLDNLPYAKAWGFTPPVPLPWECKTGTSWGDLHEYNP